MLTSVQSYDRIRQENLFENGKYAGDWLEIKSWATEKVESVFILYFTLKLHVEIPSPHSLWSRNTSRTCYIKRGVLRAVNLTVEVEW